MSLSTADTRSIIEKASTLAERFSGAFLPVVGDPKRAQGRLDRWKSLADADDPVDFAEVIRACGAKSSVESDVLGLLDEVSLKPGESWPTWSSVLADLVDTIKVWFSHPADAGANSPCLRRTEAIPFIDLYRSFAHYAWQEIELAQPVATLLGTTARNDLEFDFCQRISAVLSIILHDEFLAHKAFAESGTTPSWFSNGATENKPADANLHYRTFVREQGNAGLKDVFLRYPVAARLVAEVTADWVGFVGEFLGRLLHDHDELSSYFNQGTLVGKPASIQTGKSDPHHHGRTVLILTFESGTRLVYKPRPMLVDQLFFAVVKSFNTSGFNPPLLALGILDRGNYGWMEFAQHTSCANRAAARRFYRRAGSVACLLHWLQGVDCHRTNFIAAGEQPLVIDLEALAHPMLPSESKSTGETSFPRPLSMSILRTGLLPLWQTYPNDCYLYDHSALGAPTVQPALVESIQWKDVNADRMRREMSRKPRRNRTHRPRLKGKALFAKHFIADFTAGFSRATEILRGSATASFVVLRNQIRRAARRRIKRPTLVYWLLRRRSLRSELLTSGIDRSIELHALPRVDGELEEWLTEISDLERLDIPYFRSGANDRCDSDLLFGPSDHDFRQQSEIIRSALNHELVLVEGQIWRLRNWRKSRSTS